MILPPFLAQFKIFPAPPKATPVIPPLSADFAKPLTVYPFFRFLIKYDAVSHAAAPIYQAACLYKSPFITRLLSA